MEKKTVSNNKERSAAATEFLKQYRKVQASCEIIDEQMFEIASFLREIKREDGVTAESTDRRSEKYASSMLERLNELKLRKRVLALRLSLIKSVVGSLPPQERKVIERFYFSTKLHRASDDLMEELGFEKTHIYRLKSKAIKLVADIIESISVGQLYEESCENT